MTFTEIVREYAEAFAPPGVEVMAVESPEYFSMVYVGFQYIAEGFQHWNEQHLHLIEIAQAPDPEAALAGVLAQMLSNLGEYVKHARGK